MGGFEEAVRSCREGDGIVCGFAVKNLLHLLMTLACIGEDIDNRWIELSNCPVAKGSKSMQCGDRAKRRRDNSDSSLQIDYVMKWPRDTKRTVNSALPCYRDIRLVAYLSSTQRRR